MSPAEVDPSAQSWIPAGSADGPETDRAEDEVGASLAGETPQTPYTSSAAWLPPEMGEVPEATEAMTEAEANASWGGADLPAQPEPSPAEPEPQPQSEPPIEDVDEGTADLLTTAARVDTQIREMERHTEALISRVDTLATQVREKPDAEPEPSGTEQWRV